MGTIRSFEEIVAWQKARELNKQLYELTNEAKFSKDFGLRDQVRRASVSVMANIAEGFERSGNGEFKQFLAIAKASAGEVRSLIYVAFDVGYIDDKRKNILLDKVIEVSKMITSLMMYLRETKIKGSKF